MTEATARPASEGQPRLIAPALGAMLVTQAVVVIASLAAPVLAPLIARDLGISSERVGIYTSVIFAVGILSAVPAAGLTARLGPVRLSQWTCLLAAAGLAALAAGWFVMVALSAVLIGLAYGPGNPASSALLERVVPDRRRALVFSVKQTAVPIGGVLAGVALPAMAGLIGWQGAAAVAAAVALVAAFAVQPWRAPLDAPGREPGRQIDLKAPFRTILRPGPLRRLAVVSTCLAAVQFSTAAMMVTFLTEAAGVSLGLAGGAMSVAMGLSIGFRIGLGWVADRVGGRPVLLGLAAGMALPAAMLAAGLWTGEITALLLATSVAALSFSWNGVFLAEVAAAAPPDEVARATSGTMVSIFIGGFAGPAGFTAVAGLFGALGAGFGLLAVVALVALALLIAGGARGTARSGS